jgi:hypothetical protein
MRGVTPPEPDAAYWRQVEADPRDWSRDQKILFWWIVNLLPMITDEGVIAMPGQAPLKDSEVIEVLEAILPENESRRGERAFLDVIWNYQGQNAIIPTAEEHLLILKEGQIIVRPDDQASEREKFV